MSHSFDSPTCPILTNIKKHYKDLLSGKTLAKQKELAGKHPFSVSRNSKDWKDSWAETLSNVGYKVTYTSLSVYISIDWADDTSPL